MRTKYIRASALIDALFAITLLTLLIACSFRFAQALGIIGRALAAQISSIRPSDSLRCERSPGAHLLHCETESTVPGLREFDVVQPW